MNCEEDEKREKIINYLEKRFKQFNKTARAEWESTKKEEAKNDLINYFFVMEFQL